jgi:predicted metal-dependent TIM-barrel fold hydrolase
MPKSAVIPFIDAHCHTHGLPWDAWETLGATGCAAVVLSAGNPHVFQEVHDEVPDINDMVRYWEGAIKFSPMAEKRYLMKVFVALGVSFMTRWQQWEKGIELLPNYLKTPGVVALGETGVDPWQYWGYKCPMDEQKKIVTEEIRIAKTLDMPIILHTPTQRKGFMPEMKPEEYKRHFLDIDMDIINRGGLDHKRLVIDHVDNAILEYVLNETNAYIGIGVGVTLRYTDYRYFADAIEKNGPNRFIINTDYISELSCDLFAIPKAIREMLRRGIDESAISCAVFENANECYRLGLA